MVWRRLFLDELKVMDLFQTMQQYFFMAAGDWAENLTEAVCAHTAQHSTLHEHSVQSMVDSSLKGTSVELDTNAANLRATLKVPTELTEAGRAKQKQAPQGHRASPISRASPSTSVACPSTEAVASQAGNSTVQQLPSNSPASVVIDNTQLKALDAVRLSFDVQWPLSLVVTQVRAPKPL